MIFCRECKFAKDFNLSPKVSFRENYRICINKKIPRQIVKIIDTCEEGRRKIVQQKNTIYD